ncbi:sugar ABC transporter permease [Bacillus sp. FJAT-49705]|uniref:Sugar ABC transporter permease n=1 Tax=Cytobacillus citreus TaxID=2833586 RepID=A0ABS5NUY8_9BACI|nr:ABC transporter permease subunit [Cytobacillus citreus]MBS4191602.1 sugar ABC transporter permease [Cytobacillus citreus]
MELKTLNVEEPFPISPKESKWSRIVKRIVKDKYLILLLLPGILYFLIYRVVPMVGIVIAFKDYSAFRGFVDSPWVGLKYFKLIFQDTEVLRVIWNTLQISFLQIFFAFPISIVLALMINEVRNQFFKRVVQSIVYLPHFLSWVVVIGITVIFLRSEGLLNTFLVHAFGMNPIDFLTDPNLFKPIVILQVIWKESGWGTIIFLAALAGVDPALYEAAAMDGANRWRQIWHITLPAIKSTIIILLILRLGNVMETGFEQIFLMLNPFNMESGNVLDTFVYFKGIQQANYSFATAVGLFKGLVGLVLVFVANRLAKKFGEEGLY